MAPAGVPSIRVSNPRADTTDGTSKLVRNTTTMIEPEVPVATAGMDSNSSTRIDAGAGSTDAVGGASVLLYFSEEMW